jgi:hypothetical protein
MNRNPAHGVLHEPLTRPSEQDTQHVWCCMDHRPETPCVIHNKDSARLVPHNQGTSNHSTTNHPTTNHQPLNHQRRTTRKQDQARLVLHNQGTRNLSTTNHSTTNGEPPGSRIKHVLCCTTRAQETSQPRTSTMNQRASTKNQKPGTKNQTPGAFCATQPGSKQPQTRGPGTSCAVQGEIH